MVLQGLFVTSTRCACPSLFEWSLWEGRDPNTTLKLNFPGITGESTSPPDQSVTWGKDPLLPLTSSLGPSELWRPVFIILVKGEILFRSHWIFTLTWFWCLVIKNKLQVEVKATEMSGYEQKYACLTLRSHLKRWLSKLHHNMGCSIWCKIKTYFCKIIMIRHPLDF